MNHIVLPALIFALSLPAIPPAAAAILVADSVADYSGVQGQDNWYYGYAEWPSHSGYAFIPLTYDSLYDR